MTTHFGELLTAMVTPFDDNLNVNMTKVKEISSYLVNNG